MYLVEGNAVVVENVDEMVDVLLRLALFSQFVLENEKQLILVSHLTVLRLTTVKEHLFIIMFEPDVSIINTSESRHIYIFQ